MNSCEAKHKKSLAHHFTSSSCSTDINALHDAYGAYVQFIALSTRFVINPSMLTFRARAFVPNVLLKMLSLFFFDFFPNFSLFGRRPKKREREGTWRKRKFIITSISFADARVHAHMLRKIARSTVSKSAQMRAAVVYGSKVRACCSRVVVFRVFSRVVSRPGGSCVCAL